MKKILAFMAAFAMICQGHSQTYYSWTMNTPSFPAGFVTWNLDMQDPQDSADFPTSATGWIETNFNGGLNAYYAATTSWFDNLTIPCNRWLVTPQMAIPSGVPTVGLTWWAASLDGSFPEGYQILVSTTDSLPASFHTVIQTVDAESPNGANHAVSLAAYAGQNIRVAFRDTSLNEYAMILDNIAVVALPTNSASITDVEMYEHNYLSNPANVTGIWQNLGFDTLYTFTLNYSANGGTPVQDAVSLSYPNGVPGLGYSSYYYYTHNVPFAPTSASTYNLQIWMSGLNGTATNSDTQSVTTFFYAQAPSLQKNVVIEEMTGAGCPWCSGGALTMRDAYNNHPGFVIPVAVHSADINDLGLAWADSMQIDNGENLIDSIGAVSAGFGFPSAMVSRLYTFDNAVLATGVQTNDGNNFTYQGPLAAGYTYLWDTLAVFSHNMASPVNVSLSALTYNAGTGAFSVSVNANFLNSLSQGTYNINLYVVEDSVNVPNDGYNQDNGGYSGQGSSGNSELFNLPSVITDDGLPGDWSQNHVLRSMAGGVWGTTGVIPSAPVASTTYSHTFSGTIDPRWRPDYIHLVGIVQEYNNNVNLRTMLNAAEIPLVVPNGIIATSEFNKLCVYPNPASTMATVDMDIKENAVVNISVVNTLGQTVSEAPATLLNTGEQTVQVSVNGLAPGLYMVKVSVNGEVSSLPLSVSAH